MSASRSRSPSLENTMSRHFPMTAACTGDMALENSSGEA
jgi:hypothetical protein